MYDFKQENEVYQRHIDEWVTDYQGQFVVIYKSTVIGIYLHQDQAYREGLRAVGLDDPFLMKEIIRPEDERPIEILTPFFR